MYVPNAGGFITNPYLASDQGVPSPEPLYYSTVGPAGLVDNGATFELVPGQTVVFPGGLTQNVTVNATTSGHKFSAVVYYPPVPFPPTPQPGTFPPSGVTSIRTLGGAGAYVYEQYYDDQNVGAFFAALNDLQQSYIDSANSLNLPIYTGLSGALLDWVGTNLYGLPRPALSSGNTSIIGPFNSYVFNSVPFNDYEVIGSSDVVATSDDTYKSILTWHFYKGDGKYFSIRWLKRRVMRFITAVDGVSQPIDNTYPVSVTFSGPTCIITLSVYAPLFQEALESNVIDTPFQFEFTAVIP